MPWPLASIPHYLPSHYKTMSIFLHILSDEANLILAALRYDSSSDIIATIFRQCTSRQLFQIGLEDDSIWPLVAEHIEIISRKPPRANIFTPQCIIYAGHPYC